MTDPERFQHRYAEALYKIAEYSQYLRRQWDPVAKGIGKRLQDEIRDALLEEESNEHTDTGP